ncbi:hypothetical protein [Agromyces italicus]|uniref:hypothetical protein n=1 Tax=Agromyces italicus TaxID=279572 RepID=UPI0003B32372|nr:hypothetical protein [Agromyces italicus]
MRRDRHGGAIRGGRSVRRPFGVLAAIAVFGLTATVAVAPLTNLETIRAAAADGLARDSVAAAAQRLSVEPGTESASLSTESYVASTGPETLIDGGTNLDWAKLVIVEGGWPLTDENVTFMMRWMRQENGADNWWNRNNPLNNGQGSGGGSGLGSYVTLVEAAYYAAENLRSGRYPAVDAALAEGDSADATAQAIWASPWASSHYGYGTHWSSRPYDVIEAPASAWGR